MYKLVIADDEGKTTVVPLVRDEITIGRKEGNTIRLTDRNVSRRHARLRKLNGTYFVEDLQSYNGVKVNGRRIGGEVELKAGDQITIGDYQLALQLDDGVTIPDTTTPAVAMPNGQSEAATAMMAVPGAVLPVPAAAAQAVPPLRLVMTSPPAPGAEFSLVRPVTRIGRAEGLDVWINHRSISREHAEITHEGGTLRIRDLGSANGVRVNNRDVQEAELKPGDTIELGQVRFRVVAAGEQFVFDAERTMQVEAIPPDKPPSRLPFLAAGGIIVGVAVVVAVGAIFVTGPETQVRPIDTQDAVLGAPTPVGLVPVPAPVPGVSVDELVTGCQAALNAGQFDVAMQRATEALTAQPGHAGAIACQQQVEQQRAESETYARGLAHVHAGNLAEAYFEFEQLPVRSPYRARPEVVQAIRQYGERLLDDAERELQERPEEALHLAQTVQNMTNVETSLRRRAAEIVRRAQPLVRGATARVERGGTSRTSARNVPALTPGGGGTGGATSAGTGGSGSRTTAEAMRSGEPLMTQARACLAPGGGGHQCVVNVLGNGRARQPEEMMMLIATYQAMSNTAAMLATMEQFVRRFPDHPRTQQYRQLLARYGR
jgi:pSer/pThr/pTyr-binding forkhead associated (FHA) protein